MDWIGKYASNTTSVTAEGVAKFVDLSGDLNPIHTNEGFAKTSPFGQRIAPGLQIASYISAVIANQLPGPGSIYLEQSLRFEAPVHIGDVITTRVEVIEQPRADRLRLNTSCTNQSGVRVISGVALVKTPSSAS